MKMYVINLISRPDRYLKVFSQFEEKGIPITRIDAIYGKNLVDSGIKTIAPPNNQAVWMSHQKAFMELVKSKDNFCVIFEDDVIMTEPAFKLLQDFQKVQSDLPNIDYLQFGYLTYKGKLDSGKSDRFVRNIQRIRIFAIISISKLVFLYAQKGKFGRQIREKTFRKIDRYSSMDIIKEKLNLDAPIIFSNESGGHAYIISRKMARALLSYNNPLFLVTDLAIMSLSKAGNFDIYRTSKSLAFQDDSVVSTGRHSAMDYDIGKYL